MNQTAWMRRLRLPLAATAAAVLAACGGGGEPSNVVPTVQAQAAAKEAGVVSPSIAARLIAGDARGGAEGRAPAAKSRNLYIVQLAEPPVAGYDGGIAGYKATRVPAGKKLDSTSTDVTAYSSYLVSRHDGVLAQAGGRKVYSYSYVFNGFAAELTDAQAARLATSAGVLSVSKDEKRQLNTSFTPEFLGLTSTGDPKGLWTQGYKGENVIIGIVDSGAWPEHPSFSDRTDVNGNGTKDGKLGYQQIPGWNGKCQPGEAFNASHCNQKLIGARFYNAGYGGDAGVKAALPYEYVSPRDFDGHGTHTATTSGGNEGVAATGLQARYGKVSGMAPRARIAAYKVCWGNGVEGGCFNSDSVAAIDQAVADGVDVINFSISGSRTNYLDPVEVAFLYAADAGVFVAASAGNSGPTASTVAHPSPWITTVAAGTHPRYVKAEVTLGNGKVYAGASTAAEPAAGAFIHSTSAGLAGADAERVRLCYSAAENGGAATLDPAKVAGKIVLCERGGNARVDKSAAVKAAGGIGMVLVNVPGGADNIVADTHAVPSVHLLAAYYAEVVAYADTGTGTASIPKSEIKFDGDAPRTADFSSRGPLLAGGGNLLKPDLIAPGQDILAGVSPANYGGQSFDFLSGTSMSSPHVAGLAALFKQAKPTWSPMMIKSALMTTAGDVKDGPATDPAVIFSQGAGHVRPNDALDPGLVFDSRWNDWLAFLCEGRLLGAGTCTALKNAGYPTQAGGFNSPSISLGSLAGKVTITRRVTNPGNASATFTASTEGLTGLDVSVSPASFTVAGGKTQKLEITIARSDGAALAQYAGGQLKLTRGDGKAVRIPVVVRPVALAAPGQVSANGSATSYGVTFGYGGSFGVATAGLVPADLFASTVSDDPTDSTCSLDSPNAVKKAVSVAAGLKQVRFATFDADVKAGSDLDLCVFKDGVQVGASAGGTSSEEVALTDPAAGEYIVVVQGWGVIDSTPFTLHTWQLGTASAGNMTATASTGTATLGGTATVSLGFSGLAAGTRYLGAVTYSGSTGLPTTFVRVDTP